MLPHILWILESLKSLKSPPHTAILHRHRFFSSSLSKIMWTLNIIYLPNAPMCQQQDEYCISFEAHTWTRRRQKKTHFWFSHDSRLTTPLVQKLRELKYDDGERVRSSEKENFSFFDLFSLCSLWLAVGLVSRRTVVNIIWDGKIRRNFSTFSFTFFGCMR